MAGFAQRPYDLAISLRFGEANTEMVALKALLVERGLKVFLSKCACGRSPARSRGCASTGARAS